MTDKDLDKLFSDKLSGSYHDYRDGAWENAMASWQKQTGNSKSIDALFKEQLINAKAPFNQSAWLRFEQYQKAVLQKALIKKIAVGLSATIATLATVFWLNTSELSYTKVDSKTTKTHAKAESNLKTDKTSKVLNNKSLAANEIKFNSTENEIDKRNEGADFPPNSNKTSRALTNSRKNENAELTASSKQKNKQAFGQNYRSTDLNQPTNEVEKPFDLSGIVPMLMKGKTVKPLKVNNLKSLPLRGNSKSKKPKKWYAEIHGGLTLASPIVNNQGTNSRQSLSYLAGIGLNRELNNKFTLESGLIYYNRSAENTGITIENIGFSFGKEASITTVNPEQLHYIGVPIVANYNIFSRHYLGLGVQLGYLLAVKTESTEVLYTNNTIQSETTEKGWGYNEAFANIDAALMVNYHYLITDRLKLGASYNFGLVDITNNNVTGNQYFDRNSQFMLRLRYRVINF